LEQILPQVLVLNDVTNELVVEQAEHVALRQQFVELLHLAAQPVNVVFADNDLGHVHLVLQVVELVLHFRIRVANHEVVHYVEPLLLLYAFAEGQRFLYQEQLVVIELLDRSLLKAPHLLQLDFLDHFILVQVVRKAAKNEAFVAPMPRNLQVRTELNRLAAPLIEERVANFQFSELAVQLPKFLHCRAHIRQVHMLLLRQNLETFLNLIRLVDC